MSCGGSCNCNDRNTGSADAAAALLNRLTPTMYYAKDPPPGRAGRKAPGWLRALRITRVRAISQAFFFALFGFSSL